MARDAGPMGGSSPPVRTLRWAISFPGVARQYLADRVPLRHRHDEDLALATANVPDLLRGFPGDPDTLQRAESGVGPLFHRVYTLLLAGAWWDPEALIDFVLADLNRVAPSGVARFETFDGELVGDVETGAEFIVRIPGPWNAPVRLVERTPTSFRLATLLGNMEAGEIEFAASDDGRGLLRFTIESWARSGGRLFGFLYKTLPIGREMQLHMWAEMCEQVARSCGGCKVGGVMVSTERLR